MNSINIQNQDCIENARQLPDQSVDLIKIDPPYGVLTGHIIEQKIDIPKLFIEFKRILKPDGFICFYGLMPTVTKWIAEAEKHFLYAEHIVWAKRTITSPYLQLQRSFENLFIYKNSPQARYYKTKGRYEDLKTPALHHGLYELQTVQTTISDLYRRIADRKYDDLYFSDLPYLTGGKNDKKISEIYPQNVKNNDDWYKKSRKTESSKEDIEMLLARRKDPTNDYFYSAKEYGKIANGDSFRYRSKTDANFLNIWSFLPTGEEDNVEMESIWKYLFEPENKVNSDKEAKKLIADKFIEFLQMQDLPTVWSYLSQNQTSMASKNKEGENHKHPTVKSIKMTIRIIELLTAKPTENYTPVVYDCFLGSGTTAQGCMITGRNFIGCELSTDYYSACLQRLENYNETHGKTAQIESCTPVVKKENKNRQLSFL